MVTENVAFPAHERPQTEVNTIQMIGIAVVITFAVFGIAYVVGGFPKDLFMGLEKILYDRVFFQSLITFVWALSIANVVLKLVRLNKEKAAIAGSGLPEGFDLTDRERMISVYERIRMRPEIAESLSLTRIARVLAMWINTGDFGRTAQYAREQADLDAAESDSTFRRNRLFIWAMPLLGFVGTVYGVANGISHFAAFLHQANVSMDQIKAAIGDITTGLAVAFMCTLLGLFAAGLGGVSSLVGGAQGGGSPWRDRGTDRGSIALTHAVNARTETISHRRNGQRHSSGNGRPANADEVPRGGIGPGHRCGVPPVAEPGPV